MGPCGSKPRPETATDSLHTPCVVCTIRSSMALKPYQPSHRAARTPVVTVASHGVFRFSAEASRKAGLESAHWVRMSSDESKRLIGFEFLDDQIQPENAHRLMRSKGTSSRSCRARGLINHTPWIKEVADSGRKFELSQDPRNQRIWVIRLEPWFERSVSPEAIGKIGAAAGVYRYRDAGGKVIYIGKGRIADRYREEPQRRDWDISIIEYSQVQTDEQFKWENFHLELFKKEHSGRRPQYNLNSGQAAE